MIDESMIEKMFERWVSDSSNLTSEEVKRFREISELERIRFALFNGFKSAINLLLPIIQKQNEAIEFYGSEYSWEGREIDGCDWDDFYEEGSGIGGKLARQTKLEVEKMIKEIIEVQNDN